MADRPDEKLLRESLERLAGFADASLADTDEAPIFILSVGWGSGSTLLQRVIMTDPRVRIWGEPYGRMGLVSHLASSLASANEGWPKARFFEKHDREKLWAEWVANTYPEPAALLAGLRALLSTWLAEPARADGFERWGLKEVRFGAAEAWLIRQLFPAARFVVIVRNPYEAWASCRRMEIWWRHDERIHDVRGFARNWNALAASWLDADPQNEHRLVRYEDLAARRVDFRDLERYLDLRLAEDKALEIKVGSKRKGAPPATWRERRAIDREAGETIRRFDYE